MNRSKIKGTAWETAVKIYLQIRGVANAERRALNGVLDRGDIAGIIRLVIECKNAARIDLAGWLAEADRERENDHADYGIVWAKRRGKTSPAHGYVIMSGQQFVDLAIEAGLIVPTQPAQKPAAGDQGGEVAP